jgi:hypothetical protein
MIQIRRNLVKGHIFKYLSFYLLLFSSMIISRSYGQNDSTDVKEQIPDSLRQEISLFGSDELLNISLYFDLGSFLKKSTQNDSFDAEMIIRPGEKDSIYKKIKLKYRGVIRRELCSFPPIEINFKKPLYSDSGKIKKLKLVTHCEPGSLSDEYVIKEYLVYKLFNALTDTSFRARLLKVNYIDTKKNKKTIVKYGIFIEPVEMLAKRTNSYVLSSTTLNQNHIIPEVMDRLAIFNYMVANWDWSIPGQHNVKIIKPRSYGSGARAMAVPYDFDLTGVVNAQYAVPPPNIGIENVRDRIYSGPCRTEEVYIKDFMEFSNHREKLLSAVNECPQLNQRSKKNIILFLDEFLGKIVQPKSQHMIIERFLKTCKD